MKQQTSKKTATHYNTTRRNKKERDLTNAEIYRRRIRQRQNMNLRAPKIVVSLLVVFLASCALGDEWDDGGFEREEGNYEEEFYDDSGLSDEQAHEIWDNKYTQEEIDAGEGHVINVTGRGKVEPLGVEKCWVRKSSEDSQYVKCYDTIIQSRIGLLLSLKGKLILKMKVCFICLTGKSKILYLTSYTYSTPRPIITHHQ